MQKFIKSDVFISQLCTFAIVEPNNADMIINDNHLWLLELFIPNSPNTTSSRRYTLNEISDRWEKSALNDKGGALPRRTFHKYKQDLKDFFGIEIECDSANGYAYYISNLDEIVRNRYLQWTINALSINNMLSNANTIRDRLILEDIPGGHQYLVSLGNAIKENKKIKVEYRAFIKGETKEYVACPYAMKVYRQRWYVLCKVDKEDKLKNLAIDRILHLELTDTSFKLPANFSAEDYYAGSVGIWMTEKQQRESVVIRAYGIQVDYLRTLPFHSSQEVIATTDTYSDFQYYLVVTPDLVRQILARGSELEVIKPASLRQELKDEIIRMSSRY